MFVLSGEQCFFSLEETHCVKRSQRKPKPSGNESQNDARFFGFARQSKSKCNCKISQTCFITEQLFLYLCLLYVSHLSVLYFSFISYSVCVCVCVCVCVFSQNVIKEDHVEYAPIAMRR